MPKEKNGKKNKKKLQINQKKISKLFILLSYFRNYVQSFLILYSSDSDDEKSFKSKKKKKKKAWQRILDSDSDVKITDCTLDSDNSSEASNARHSNASDNTRKEKEKLRKRRKCGDSSDTDSLFAEKK